MRRLTLAAVLALIAAAPAAAHVIPQPAYLAPGERVTITFAAPNERPPHVLTGLIITAPAGITLATVPAPQGWTLSAAGTSARWTGSSVATAQRSHGPFRVAVSTSLAPGAVSFHATQRYDDGGVVRWTIAFTILPAATATPRQHLLPAIVTAILGLAVIGLLLFRMRDRRQPPLQEE